MSTVSHPHWQSQGIRMPIGRSNPILCTTIVLCRDPTPIRCHIAHILDVAILGQLYCQQAGDQHPTSQFPKPGRPAILLPRHTHS